METSAVLTIVVSIVERKSAIQSLPGIVSLSTSPKLYCLRLDVLIPKRQQVQSPALVKCRAWLGLLGPH